MPEYGFSQTRIFPYKRRGLDSILILENEKTRIFAYFTQCSNGAFYGTVQNTPLYVPIIKCLFHFHFKLLSREKKQATSRKNINYVCLK